MRIAQVAPLTESVPPQLYGGTERVVAFLTDELVRLGHDVTLFASGDSKTAGRLVPLARALRLSGDAAPIDLRRTSSCSNEIVQSAHEFDVLHFHLAQLHFPLVRRLPVAHVTTLHGRLDMPELVPLYREFQRHPSRVDLRRAARSRFPTRAGRHTIHHGMPLDLLRFHPGPGEYLAFLGRISPEKRVDRAIAIATGCGQPAENRRQDRPARRQLLRAGDQAAARTPARRVRGRNQRAAERRLPRPRHGTALPHRLAGAIRPGDDRSDGLRHAGRRLPRRLGRGSRSTTASPASSSTRCDDAIAATRAAASLDAILLPRGLRAALQRHTHGQRYLSLYEQLLTGRPSSGAA